MIVQWWSKIGIQPKREVTLPVSGNRMNNPESSSPASVYELFIKSVVDYAIYTLDSEGRVTNWNVGAERIKGLRLRKLYQSAIRLTV
jgi:hypothetical protein